MSTPSNPLPDGELLPPMPDEASLPIVATPNPLPPPPTNPPWTIAEVGFLAAFFLFLMLLVPAVVFGILLHRHPLLRPETLVRNPRFVIPIELFNYIWLLIAMVWLLRSRGLRFWNAIQWNWPRNWISFLGIGVGLAFSIQLVSILLPIPKQVPFDQYFTDAKSAYLLAFFGVAIAPLMEELFFRGFLFPVLMRHISVPLAVIATAFAFALMHASQLASAWGPLFLIFLVGVTLTLTRLRANSLAASVLVHIGYNSTLFSVMYIATNHFRNFDKLH